MVANIRTYTESFRSIRCLATGWCWILLLGALALCPFYWNRASADSTVSGTETPDWPVFSEEGLPLVRLPLSDSEERFLKRFPGTVARFSDGRCHYLYRWVTRPTRKLHPTRDCLRGLGYRVKESQSENAWARFTASRGQQRWVGRERLREANGDRHWTSVSAWYWHALFEWSEGPWIAETILEPR